MTENLDVKTNEEEKHEHEEEVKREYKFDIRACILDNVIFDEAT